MSSEESAPWSGSGDQGSTPRWEALDPQVDSQRSGAAPPGGRVPGEKDPGAKARVADRAVPWRRVILLAALAPLAQGLFYLARAFPSVTERFYARGFYPRLAALEARLQVPGPFSLAEGVLLLAGLWVLWSLLRAGREILSGRRGLGNALLRGAAFCAAVAGVLVALFQLTFGLNHARQPLAKLLGLEVSPLTPSDLAELTSALGDAAALQREASRAGEGSGSDAELRLAWRRAGERYPFLAGPWVRARGALASPWLTRAGLAGIYFPFTGEPHVNTQVPPFALAYTEAHEQAHQRGIAREDEAGFAAWLVCQLSPDPAVRYSGSLLALSYALVALQQASPRLFRKRYQALPDAVRGDLEELWSFWIKGRTTLSKVAGQSNDLFLRSQGQRGGVKSYGRMLDLLQAWRLTRGCLALLGDSPLQDF